MKYLVVLVLVLKMHQICFSQSEFTDTAAAWFEELKMATRQNLPLWKQDIYAPLLLVDPSTRNIYANTPDSNGNLTLTGNIYTGQLPETVNIANTAIEWAGQYWAMVMLPLPENKHSRIHLLAHELFHRAQKQMGFFPASPDNNHLDKKNGRLYLRLELEALKKAVLAPTRIELMKHLTNAIYFRRERHNFFPGSDTTENLLELNEGLCEFTGFMMSGREGYEARKYFVKRITEFTNSISYIRSFAYETIPVYGFLLNPTKKGWNREVLQTTNLTDFFSNAFMIPPPDRRRNNIVNIGKEYDYSNILAEESVREQQFLEQYARYRFQFIDTVHIEIPLIKMNMSFDYTRQFSLDSLGMVYPSIRITDEWGILQAEKGALINAGWNQVNISLPVAINGEKIEGDGWTLELNSSFTLEKDEVTGNYRVKRSEE